MFSTVDSPAARFVRIYIATDAGRLPIAPPPRLAKIVSELQAAPSQERVNELARLLGDEAFIDEQVARRRLWTMAGASAADVVERSQLVAASDIEKAQSSEAVIVPRNVAVELWQYSFDKPTRTVAATLRFSAGVTAD